MITWSSTNPSVVFSTTCPWVDWFNNKRFRLGWSFGLAIAINCFWRLVRLFAWFGRWFLWCWCWCWCCCWWCCCWCFGFLWNLDLNALDSFTSFIDYLFLDLFRTATYHSDGHCACLLVIYLVLNFSCSQSTKTT
ncbi:hypothetical protein NC652_015490 [Populus alba x Populus x berolinensis]|nr:hypothetical protein NC652_015490 [Populus alba x Populus x berolinensis]